MKLSDSNANRAATWVPTKPDTVLAIDSDLICTTQLAMQFLEVPSGWVVGAVPQRGRVNNPVHQAGGLPVQLWWNSSPSSLA